MTRKGQINDLTRIGIAFSVAFVILLILYGVVQLQVDYEPPETGICYPSWDASMTTRSVLQTRLDGQTVRQRLGRRVYENGPSAGNKVLDQVLPDTGELNWFWDLNDRRSGKPGIAGTVTGSTEAADMLAQYEPVTYTYKGKTITVIIVALDEENPCGN
mgnify:CR=1 FL=1